MDALDRKVIAELQSRGYVKADTLATILGVGERTIRRRIDTMIGEGMIKVIAVPNPVLFGAKAWAMIGIKVETGSLGHVARELVKQQSVYFVAYTLGAYNLMVAVYFDTMNGLTHFVSSQLVKIRSIVNTETMLLTWPRKYYRFSWPALRFFGESNRMRPASRNLNSHDYQIDETSRKIVKTLMEDGLTRHAGLRLKVGIGETTLRKRIKDMLRAGVFSTEVVPNPSILEQEVWITIGITIRHQSAQSVIDAILQNPAVYLASVSIGRFNVVMSACFHNIDLLRSFIDSDLPGIEGVSSIETFLHSRILKYHNIGWYQPKNQ